MNKKEIIWREILFQFGSKRKAEFTQKQLAEKYQFSSSTVFNALKVPRASGAIKVGGRGFKIQDVEKFLHIWATFRNLSEEVIYKTAVDSTVQRIENKMPPKIIFGAFSAFRKKYEQSPADYDKVYIYSEQKNLDSVKSRFPSRKGYTNLVVLKADPWLKKFGSITPDCQTFVDLWNLSEWYAKDFLQALKQKML